jgi:hypothetical protein
MDMLNKLLVENAEFGDALSYAVHNEALFVAWVRKSGHRLATPCSALPHETAWSV